MDDHNNSDVCTITLSTGDVCLVDADDLPLLSRWRWNLVGGGYAARNTYDAGRKRFTTVYMHHMVLNPGPGEQIDHKNRNKLDNRKENLRSVPQWQNQHNRPMQSNNVAAYGRGVTWSKARQKWQARIQVNGRKFFLGYFSTAADAHAAYSVARAELVPPVWENSSSLTDTLRRCEDAVS